jgi:hypothetical protein
MAKKEPEKEPLSAPEVLAGFVPDGHIAAYEKLRLDGGVPSEQAAGFVGSAELVRELTGLGLAYLIPHTATSPAMLRAAPLDFALMGALGAVQARLAREQELVLKGNLTLLELQAQAGRDDGIAPEHQLKVLSSSAEVLEMQRELAARAHRDWMVLDSGRTDMPVTDDYTLCALPALREQVRQRTIYDAKLLENTAVMRCIRQSVADGEIARTLPCVEVRLLIVDEIAVMVPFGWTGSAGAVVIYAEPAIKLARDLFEMKWSRSTPLGGSARDGCPLSDKTIQVLELLAEGRSDESVAKVIDRGKSTVQRYLDPVITLLGLKSPSRFQLGFMVGRSGLLGTPECNHTEEEHHG